ncbi:MAG: hypothetical protein KDB88_02765 [Flavobacteriales bacterium]|nr:hypothetical protein [Flavobacteriales bacterium]
MISTIFGKKKITEEKLANVFVNALLELIDKGFPAIVAELKDSPEFVTEPGIETEDATAFALIVLAGNLMELKRQLPPGQDRRLVSLSISKFAQATQARTSEVEQHCSRLNNLMARLNQPSKNTVRAMSLALFHQYDLFEHQKPYFAEQRVPDPIILKRVSELMGFFIWDWDSFHDQYRIAS